MKRYIPVCVILFLLAFCSCSKEKLVEQKEMEDSHGVRTKTEDLIDYGNGSIVAAGISKYWIGTPSAVSSFRDANGSYILKKDIFVMELDVYSTSDVGFFRVYLYFTASSETNIWVCHAEMTDSQGTLWNVSDSGITQTYDYSGSREKVTLYNGTPELLGHHFYMEFRFLSFFSGMDVPDFCSFGEMDCYWGHLGEGQQHSTDCSLQNYSW